MKIEFGNLRVVEVKLGVITCQLGDSQVHIHLRVPYKHDVKTGDLLPLYTWVPIYRAKLDPASGKISEIIHES